METEEEFLQIFYDIDKDKSGAIELNEVEIYLRKHGFQSEFIKLFIDTFDLNKDGKITFKEFINSLKKMPLKHRNYTEWFSLFKRLDEDSNGYITIGELFNIIQESDNKHSIKKKQLSDFVQKNDLDNDGLLNYNEFLKFIGTD